MKKAVILLSGGLDSATCLAIAKQEGYELHALSFNYGQRHEFEIDAARAFGGSALTDDIEVPKKRDANQILNEIPITYVPARNTIFLSFGLAFAETIKSNDIFIGVNALDYSGYPDCRPEYIESFEKMAQLATKSGTEKNNQITIHTPLIQLTKAEIIKAGLALGVNYGITHSCYDPVDNGNPCGACDACQIRLKGFLDAGLSDPLVYNK